MKSKMKGFCIAILLSFICCKKQEKKQVIKENTNGAVQTKPAIAEVDSADFDILKFLVKEEVGNEKDAVVDLKDHSVKFPNDGDSYQITFSKIAAEDFNNDGIADYIINRQSEGMLGGSANTNSEILYLIMNADNTIATQHHILTYAPFSYNILENVEYSKGILKAVAKQNFRTYMSDSLQSTDLEFLYQNGNVYEKSYLTDCKLAEWKSKNIFKNATKAFRTIDMHNYTEVVEESYKEKGFELTANVSGCDNLSIVFEGNFQTSNTSKKNIDEKRKFFLDFLVSNTNFKSILSTVNNYYLHNIPSEEFIKKGNLSFKIFTNKEKDGINFRLVLDQETNPNQLENWDITTRAK